MSPRSYGWLLTSAAAPSTSSWKPKYANENGAQHFNIMNWRAKYRNELKKAERAVTAANKAAVKAAVNKIMSNFESTYRTWLTGVAQLRSARRARLNAEFAALRKEIAARRRVARTPAVERRENLKAAARHAGATRPVSPRRRVLTARLPSNAVERERARVASAALSAKLTSQLQSVVNAVEANLRAKANAKLRSPNRGHSR